jgi:hypothetical protein
MRTQMRAVVLVALLSAVMLGLMAAAPLRAATAAGVSGWSICSAAGDEHNLSRNCTAFSIEPGVSRCCLFGRSGYYPNAFHVRLMGTGFSQATRVRVNGVELPLTNPFASKQHPAQPVGYESAPAMLPGLRTRAWVHTLGAPAKLGVFLGFSLPGSATITVLDAAGATLASYTFSFENPKPQIASLRPLDARDVHAGGRAFSLRVAWHGCCSGFKLNASSIVRWNGEDRPTSFVPVEAFQGTLRAQISAADIANAGTARVTVFNPGPGGGESDALTFVIAPS